MVGHVVANDPLELSMGVVGHDTLIKPVSVIVGVLLGLRLPAELRVASPDFSTVANRGPMIPVEGLADAEILGNVVVNAELNVSGVQDPSLVASWIAGNVVEYPCPIRRSHKWCYPGRGNAE